MAITLCCTSAQVQSAWDEVAALVASGLSTELAIRRSPDPMIRLRREVVRMVRAHLMSRGTKDAPRVPRNLGEVRQIKVNCPDPGRPDHYLVVVVEKKSTWVMGEANVPPPIEVAPKVQLAFPSGAWTRDMTLGKVVSPKAEARAKAKAELAKIPCSMGCGGWSNHRSPKTGQPICGRCSRKGLK